MSDNIKKTLSKAEAINKLWRIPNLTYKLDTTQNEMYTEIHGREDKIVVLACSRGLGKSYFLLTMAIEACLKKPNSIVKYLAPTIKDLKNIVLPNYRQIIEDCPKDLLPQYNKTEGKIIFQNGSEIHLAGTENGNAEKVRGVSADLCLVDEAGFCDDLDYIVKSILFPTITRGNSTKGKKIILASTPSKTNDHDFIAYMKDHDFKGKLIKRTVYQNPRLLETARNEGYNTIEEYVVNVLASEYPEGVNATAFKREYLVKIVTEENSAVIPEFTEELQQKIVIPSVRPSHYDGYVSMDIGFSDLTAVLFAYYDFSKAQIVICDELVLSGNKMLTDNLAYEILQKEKGCFPGKYDQTKTPYIRVADNNNPILLQDLTVKHGLNFLPTKKDDFEAALNNMRILMKSEKIVIDPKCTILVKHLQGATWNKQRNNFARSPDSGHYDAVSALIYLCRNIHFGKNPFPNEGYNPEFHYKPEYGDTKMSEEHKQIVNAFKPKIGKLRYK